MVSVKKDNRKELSIRWKALKQYAKSYTGTTHGMKKRDLMQFYCERHNITPPNKDYDRWILSLHMQI